MLERMDLEELVSEWRLNLNWATLSEICRAVSFRVDRRRLRKRLRESRRPFHSL